MLLSEPAVCREEALRYSVQCCEGGWSRSVLCQATVYLVVALPAVAQSQAFATITLKPARSPDPPA
jgi:hypothetical protein